MWWRAAVAAWIGAALAGAAGASDVVEAVRAGVFAHDVDLLNNGAGGKENGVNVHLQAVFASPPLLRLALSPRPYVVASLNTGEDTSYGGGGLSWRTPQERWWAVEFDLGLVIHDGVVDLPEDPGDPERIRLDRERVVLGSRDLFRVALGAGVRVSERVEAQVVLEHLSHGQILGDGRNEGLDSLGLRLSYRPGG